MTSWWLLVRPCNPCLLCEEVDLSSTVSTFVRLQSPTTSAGKDTCMFCMHMETPKAFKRVRQNSIHYHTKLDVRKRTATKCTNFTLSACHLSLDSARSSVFQYLMSWKKMGAIKMTQTAHGKTASRSAMAI